MNEWIPACRIKRASSAHEIRDHTFTISMTMNGLPEVNIQGVRQYWTHFFLAFLSVYIHSKCRSWGGFEKFRKFAKPSKLLHFRLVYKVGPVLWNTLYVYFTPFLVTDIVHSIKKVWSRIGWPLLCRAVLWRSRHLYTGHLYQPTQIAISSLKIIEK